MKTEITKVDSEIFINLTYTNCDLILKEISMFRSKDENDLNLTYEVLQKEIINRIIGSKAVKK